jgi:epoxyqueuosine reductase
MKSVGTSIKQKALDLGFLDCGIVPSAMLEEEQRHLKAWLSEGMHGEMGYMERNPRQAS